MNGKLHTCKCQKGNSGRIFLLISEYVKPEAFKTMHDRIVALFIKGCVLVERICGWKMSKWTWVVYPLRLPRDN